LDLEVGGGEHAVLVSSHRHRVPRA
jgi:hypothetical protein